MSLKLCEMTMPNVRWYKDAWCSQQPPCSGSVTRWSHQPIDDPVTTMWRCWLCDGEHTTATMGDPINSLSALPGHRYGPWRCEFHPVALTQSSLGCQPVGVSSAFSVIIAFWMDYCMLDRFFLLKARPAVSVFLLLGDHVGILWVFEVAGSPRKRIACHTALYNPVHSPTAACLDSQANWSRIKELFFFFLFETVKLLWLVAWLGVKL